MPSAGAARGRSGAPVGVARSPGGPPPRYAVRAARGHPDPEVGGAPRGSVRAMPGASGRGQPAGVVSTPPARARCELGEGQ